MEKNAFIPYLYSGSDIQDIIRELSTALSLSGDAEKRARAEKLDLYSDLITDMGYLRTIRDWMNEFYDLVDRRYPELLFSLEGRRKALVSFYKKMLFLQEKNLSKDPKKREAKPLDRLKDLFAFRIILFDQEPDEMINLLYQVADLIIDFFVMKGFEAISASEAKGTGNFNPVEHPEVVVPEKSMISEKNRNFVKDYVIEPKDNGYQSLHIVFYDKMTRHYFEIQLRTFSMHVHAESSDEANHELYKNSTYGTDAEEKIEYSRIHIRGFAATKNGYIDNAGLLDSLPILRRQKTCRHPMQG